MSNMKVLTTNTDEGQGTVQLAPRSLDALDKESEGKADESCAMEGVASEGPFPYSLEDVDRITAEIASRAPKRGAPPVVSGAQVDSPRTRMQEVARGTQRLAAADVTSLLAEHLLATEGQAKKIGDYCTDLFDYFADPQTPNTDPEVTLSLLTKLSKLRQSHIRDVRKTGELLVRLSNPHRPRVQILSVGADEINLKGR